MKRCNINPLMKNTFSSNVYPQNKRTIHFFTVFHPLFTYKYHFGYQLTCCAFCILKETEKKKQIEKHLLGNLIYLKVSICFNSHIMIIERNVRERKKSYIHNNNNYKVAATPFIISIIIIL